MPEVVVLHLRMAYHAPNRHERAERAHQEGRIVDRPESLSRQVRERRKSLQLTQDELADLAGCSPRFVRSLEAGKPGVRLDKVLDILAVLGLELRLEPRRPS